MVSRQQVVVTTILVLAMMKTCTEGRL